MIPQPSKLLLRQARRLFPDQAEQERFIQSLLSPAPSSPHILWVRDKPHDFPINTERPSPDVASFIDRLPEGEKPGRHPLHDEGYYYCLDYSSAFAASVLLDLPRNPDLIVDLCASPGGKSVFAWKALKPKRILCNEVMGKRIMPLISNLKRCDIKLSYVISEDTGRLAEKIPEAADVVIVDAPCSGQSLPAKEVEAAGCFHPVLINKNASRQKRIIANASKMVKPGGYMAYMTCTFAEEENEKVLSWFLKRFEGFHPVSVSHLLPYQSPYASFPCYRLWPHQLPGAGCFTALLRRDEESPETQSIDWESINLHFQWKNDASQ